MCDLFPLRKTFSLGAYSLIAISLFSFTCRAESPPQAPTLRLGVLQSLTGIAAEYGKSSIRSVELAAKNAEATGRLRIEVITEDDHSDPKSTVSAYQALKTKGVDAILGATWDFTTNAILPLAGRDKTVLFTSTAHPESLNLDEAKGYGFANLASLSEFTKPFGQYLRREKITSVYFLYANNRWGEALLTSCRAIAEAAAVKIAGAQPSGGYDENDWSSQAAKIKALKPGAVALLLNKGDLEIFLKKASELHFGSKLFGSSNGYDAFRLSKIPQVYEGLCFPYPSAQLRRSRSFFEEYKRRFAEEPRISADSSYDAVGLIAEAFLAHKKTKQSLRDALEDIRGHEGIVGHYTFSKESSFSLGGASLLCVRNGEFLEDS